MAPYFLQATRERHFHAMSAWQVAKADTSMHQLGTCIAMLHDGYLLQAAVRSPLVHLPVCLLLQSFQLPNGELQRLHHW